MAPQYDFGTEPDDPFSTLMPALIGEEDKQQEWGLPAMQKRSTRMQQLAVGNYAKQHDNAMSMLRAALNEKTDEVTPGQAVNAGILALLPSLGGLLAGAMVKKPTLSPHAQFTMEQLQGAQVGPAAGFGHGAELGSQLSSSYLDELKAMGQQKQKQDLMMAQAENEWGQGLAEKELDIAGDYRKQLGQAEGKLAMLGPETDAAIKIKQAEEKAKAQYAQPKAIDPNNLPASQEQKKAVASQLIQEAGPNATEEDKANIENYVMNSTTQTELQRNAGEQRRMIHEKRAMTGDVPVAIGAETVKEVSQTAGVPIQLDYILKNYEDAVAKIPAGFAGGVARRGLANLPANEQALIMANLDVLSMGVAKAAGAGQLSDQERQVTSSAYKVALDLDKLPEAVAADYNRRVAMTRSRLQTAAGTGNIQASQLLQTLEPQWQDELKNILQYTRRTATKSTQLKAAYDAGEIGVDEYKAGLRAITGAK